MLISASGGRFPLQSTRVVRKVDEQLINRLFKSFVFPHEISNYEIDSTRPSKKLYILYKYDLFFNID